MYFNLKLDFNISVNTVERQMINEFVNWNEISELNKREIKENIDELLNKMNLVNDEVLNCRVVGCADVQHKRRLNEIFEYLKDILLESTSQFK